MQDDKTNQHCPTLIRKKATHHGPPLLNSLLFTSVKVQGFNHNKGLYTINAGMTRYFTENSLSCSQMKCANIWKTVIKY